MDSMVLIRGTVGLIIIVVAGFLALKRAWFLFGLVRSGQPAVGRTDQVGARVQVEATEVLGQKKLLKWSVPGIAHVLRVLRVPDPDPHGRRGLRGAVHRRTSRSRSSAPGRSCASSRTCSRSWCSSASLVFAVDPLPEQPRQGGPLVAVLRLAHLRRLAGPVHDLHGRRDAAVLPRRQDQRRAAAEGMNGAFASQRVASRPRAARRDRQRLAADPRPLGARRGHPRLPADRAAQQAPAHLRRPDQRVLLAPPRRPRAAAGDVLRHREDRLRGPRRRRHLRPRPDRGLHLEGPAGHGDLHRVRSLPEPVPGVEHREAAEPEAHDHEPARPRLHQGAVHHGHAGQARREERGVRRGRRGGPGHDAREGPGRGRPPADRRAGLRPAPRHRRLRRLRPPLATRARSSTSTPCGRARPAVRASTSAPWTSSTSTTSSTCAATR